MATLRLLFGLLLGALLVGATAMAQLSGTYTLGNSDPDPDDYASFTAAVAALTAVGVSGPVTFNVEELTYSESITIGPITGASADNTITFRDAGTLDTPPAIVAAASPAVNLNGADYITFDGINISVTVVGTAVQMTANADYNTIKNGTLTGTDETNSSNYGVYINGNNNDRNVIDNVTVSHTIYYPVYMAGASTPYSVGNQVCNCTLSGGRYGVRLNHQDNAVVRNCDIQAGWAAATTSIAGITATTQAAGETLTVYGNKIHGMQSTGDVTGISVGGATGSVLLCYNNFIGDFTQLSGSSKAYGIQTGVSGSGGNCYLYFNTIFVPQVVSTGVKYGIYIDGAYDTLKNNIVVMGQTDATANYGIYRYQGLIRGSDFNCLYSSGGGAGYKMGYYSYDYTTLAAWQAGTGFDQNSVAGNPGFISATDLHINADSGLVHLRAVPIAGITTDIDGQARWSLPDIGADEYAFNAPSADYWVRKLLGWTWLNPELTAITTDAVVVNRGSANQTNVPVVFFYDGLPQDTDSVSLDAYTSDTVTFHWTTPTQPDTIVLEAQSFLTGDTVLANDSALASVRIIGQPMHGTYDIGGGANHYATIAAAVTDLTLRTVDGAVTFNVYELVYIGNDSLGQITGASATNTITFRDAGTLDVRPLIKGGAGTTSGVVKLKGADYVTFDGIDIQDTIAGCCVWIEGGACYNTIKNCTITGLVAPLDSRGFWYQQGTVANVSNLIDHVTFNQTWYAVGGNTSSGPVDQGLEVRYCTVTGTQYGVSVSRVNNTRIHDNDISVGWTGCTVSVTAISLSPIGSDSGFVYNNKIHGVETTGSYTGIFCAGDATAIRWIYNNFFWGVNQPSGSNYSRAMRLNYGVCQVYFNTIFFQDVVSTGEKDGIYLGASGVTVTMKNNIIVMGALTSPCYGIYRSAGTLVSDYNCFYGTGTGYRVGYSGSAYATLAAWQTLGYDLNSVAGDPGFVSATDLHIDSLATLVDSAGTPIARITDDIDGDLRGTPPDMGADEYAAVYPTGEVDSLTIFPDADAGNTILCWAPAARANSYKIYAGDTFDFVIDGTTYLGETDGTTYTHVGILNTGVRMFYVVLASTDHIARLR
jgi:hypothetical protein